MTVGVLKLTIEEAIFTRDTATFLSMNPQYKLNWKDEAIDGKIAYDGGKTPKWNKCHELNIGEDLSCVGVISFTFVDESDLIC